MASIGSHRNDALDAVRAILIFSVVIFHYFVFWAPPYIHTNYYHFTHTYPLILSTGSLGVSVFFIVSGIVITMTVSKRRDAIEFLYRRFSRLFPAFFICCTLTYILSIFFMPNGRPPGFLDYLQNFTWHADRLGGQMIDGAYWSLGVELRFYLWVAFFTVILKSRLWIGLCGIGVLKFLQDLLGLHFTDYFMVGAYIHYFLAGMALWYVKTGERLPAMACGGIATVLYLMQMGQIGLRSEFNLIANIYVLLLTFVTAYALLAGLGAKWPLGPLPYLGRLSYAFYLLHQQIGLMIIQNLKMHTGTPDLAAAGVATAVCLGLSALVYHYVEGPAQAFLRERWPDWSKLKLSRVP